MSRKIAGPMERVQERLEQISMETLDELDDDEGTTDSLLTAGMKPEKASYTYQHSGSSGDNVSSVDFIDGIPVFIPEHPNCRASTAAQAAGPSTTDPAETSVCARCGNGIALHDPNYIEREDERYCNVSCLNEEVNQ